MKIVCSERIARDFGDRILAADPGAELLVASVREGALAWSGDVAAADACCFSEDFWQDEDLRRLVLPVVFRLEGLRWFHTFSAGVDNPAFQALVDRGTILTNSSGASAPAIAQYVLAMMIARVKPLDAWRQQQDRREWRQLPAGELTGQVCGVVGVGAIGGEVARLARAFGMRVIGMRRGASPAPDVDEQVTPARLLDLLARSDFVVIACPLTPETDGLIGEPELRTMKPSATLVNIARGRVVREDALARALREGWIAHACLDVFEREPLPEASELWTLPNVTITPHNSGFSPLNMERQMAIFVDNLGRLIRGEEMRNRVS